MAQGEQTLNETMSRTSTTTGTPNDKFSGKYCLSRAVRETANLFSAAISVTSTYYFVKGFCDSPGARLSGGLRSLVTNMPRVGARFALAGSLIPAIDWTMTYVRQKHDDLSLIAAAAAAVGALDYRRVGIRAFTVTAPLVGLGGALLHRRYTMSEEILQRTTEKARATISSGSDTDRPPSFLLGLGLGIILGILIWKKD